MAPERLPLLRPPPLAPWDGVLGLLDRPAEGLGGEERWTDCPPLGREAGADDARSGAGRARSGDRAGDGPSEGRGLGEAVVRSTSGLGEGRDAVSAARVGSRSTGARAPAAPAEGRAGGRPTAAFGALRPTEEGALRPTDSGLDRSIREVAGRGRAGTRSVEPGRSRRASARGLAAVRDTGA